MLISPTSVLTALAMTANGAENDTLDQMEAVFGIEIEPLRDYMKSYIENLPNKDKYKLHMANSIWIKDDENFTVNEDFIKTSETCFKAEVYEKEFNQKTLKEINKWVKKNTDGMIEEILNEIPQDAVMFLINALAFDAEWAEIYETTQVRDGKFTLSNGMQQDVEYMYSDENVYLEDEKGTKAGAATVVEVKCESAMESLDSKTVRLDRPFIYMIIDCETNQPIFMGTMQQVVPLLECGLVDE